jgi:hypothetical protein
VPRKADDHAAPDGPKREIPAHRLAPWGSAKARSSYRGRVKARTSPGAVVQPKGRTPGVFAKQAVKTIACGTPDVSGAFVATTLVCFHFLHTGLRTHRASGVPRALSTEGDDVNHSLFAFARTGLIPRALDVETRRENACACRVASAMQIRADASATGESWIAASIISLRRHAIRSIVSAAARAFKISRNEMRKMPCSQ